MSFETLLEELANPAESPAASKLAALSGMRAEEQPRFRTVWQHLEEHRRQTLLQELIDLAEDNVELDFDQVFLIALSDPDPDIRRAAIQGLWEHESRDLIEPLIGLLDNDPDAGVRAEAALALGRFVLQSELGIGRPSDRDQIEAALRRTITDPTEIAEVRARALESLGARSEDWVRDLIQDAYDSDDRRLCISAVHAMGRNADCSWLSALYSEFDSDDAEMRYEAATAVGAIAEPESIEHLGPLLQDEDAEVQEAAVIALGQIGGPEAKELLEGLETDDSPRLREAVEEALAEVEFSVDPLAFKMPS